MDLKLQPKKRSQSNNLCCLPINVMAAYWFVLAMQVGFGSGFKVGSCVWEALKTFQDPRHAAWEEVTPEKTEQMWKDLERMGVVFVNGVLPSYEVKKKLAAEARNKKGRVKDDSSDISNRLQNHESSPCATKANGQASRMVTM